MLFIFLHQRRFDVRVLRRTPINSDFILDFCIMYRNIFKRFQYKNKKLVFVGTKLFELKEFLIHRGLAEVVSDNAGLGRMLYILNIECNVFDEISKILKVRIVNRKKHHKWFIQNVDWRLFYHSDIWRLSGTELRNVLTVISENVMRPIFKVMKWWLNMSQNGISI